MTAFTSAIAMTGTKRQKSRNSVKNRPNVPANVAISMMVGVYEAHVEGRNDRSSDDTMITNRSNHIPMFTKMLMTNTASTDPRTPLNQRSCGITTLHVTIVQ